MVPKEYATEAQELLEDVSDASFDEWEDDDESSLSHENQDLAQGTPEAD